MTRCSMIDRIDEILIRLRGSWYESEARDVLLSCGASEGCSDPYEGPYVTMDDGDLAVALDKLEGLVKLDAALGRYKI